MDEVTLFSDGCALDNPGPGGWGAILRCRGKEKEMTGGELQSTNNRMEMMGVIEGLRSLKRPCRVEVVSDSQYVIKGITQWIGGWKKKGWKNAAGEPVKNRELWEALEAAASPHQIKWTWVKGHAGHPENERCDVLAKEEALRVRAGHGKLSL